MISFLFEEPSERATADASDKAAAAGAALDALLDAPAAAPWAPAPSLPRAALEPPAVVSRR